MDFMKGIIDMHVHSNPDLRKRRYDDFELTDAAIKVGARAIVIKTHQGTTVDRTYLCNRYKEIVYGDKTDFTMCGSVTLNRQIGGINPWAVESGLKLGAKVIWLPTASARNHLNKMNSNLDNAVDVLKDGKVTNELKDVFKLIKDHDAVLATAHISPEECFVVVEEAKKQGIDKIVVTHPEWWVVDMTLEDQVKIVKDYDVYLERCYASNMGGGKYKSNLPSNLECIKEVGADNIIISTDGGQVENPNWEIALNEYVTYMYENRISKEDIFKMTRDNQLRLLNL